MCNWHHSHTPAPSRTLLLSTSTNRNYENIKFMVSIYVCCMHIDTSTMFAAPSALEYHRALLTPNRCKWNAREVVQKEIGEWERKKLGKLKLAKQMAKTSGKKNLFYGLWWSVCDCDPLKITCDGRQRCCAYSYIETRWHSLLLRHALMQNTQYVLNAKVLAGWVNFNLNRMRWAQRKKEEKKKRWEKRKWCDNNSARDRTERLLHKFKAFNCF